MRTFLRRTAGLAAAALFCLSALGGCTGPAQSSPAQSGAVPEAGTDAAPAADLLDDGRLRIFQDSALFRGAECLLTAQPNGSVRLLEDSGGDDCVYAVLAGPEGSDAYVYSVLDANGRTVYDCGTDVPQSLVNGWLLAAPDSSREANTRSQGPRFVHLETGEVRSAPENAFQFSAAGTGHYLVNCSSSGYTDGTYSSQVVVLDDSLQEVARFTDCYANCSPDSSPWAALYPASPDGARLYNVETGETIAGFYSFCGGSVVQLRPEGEDGPYVLADLDTGEMLGQYDTACSVFLGGNALLWDTGTGGNFYYRLCRADGSTAPAYAYDESEGRLLVLLEDSAECYDESGALVYALPLAPEALESSGDWVSYSITDLGGERFLLFVYGEESRQVICGPGGPICELVDYSGAYHPAGTSYLVASREGLNGAWLCDILSLDGQPLVMGLVQSYGTLAGDVIPARRGFEEGWMDLSGNWLWKRSIWQSASDEGVASYYW